MKPVVIKRFFFGFLSLGAISTLVYLNAINQSKYKEDRREFKEGYSLSTLEELKEKCKIDKRWPTFNSCLEYEVHMNERLFMQSYSLIDIRCQYMKGKTILGIEFLI